VDGSWSDSSDEGVSESRGAGPLKDAGAEKRLSAGAEGPDTLEEAEV